MRSVFIGDEVTAAGFGLTGVQYLVTDPEQVAAVLERAIDDADLVLITAEYASHIDGKTLARYQTSLKPLFLVIDDVNHRREPRDIARDIRRRLGVREDIARK